MTQSTPDQEEAGLVWYLTSLPGGDMDHAVPQPVVDFNPEREAREAPPNAHGFLYSAFTQIVTPGGQNLTIKRDGPIFRSATFLIADRLELLDRKEVLHLSADDQAVVAQHMRYLRLDPQVLRIRYSGAVVVMFREPHGFGREVLLDVA